MADAKKPETSFLACLLILAAGIFLCGISWGLPSRSVDPFLFGDRIPWNGREILALAPDWAEDANRAADVASHPLDHRDRPIVLNQTDSQRAAIVRRFRLYSDQPDEMITLRALAQMKPEKLQLDPKLYQYGGLWIYPIAALLKIASLFHLVRLTPNLAYYLDHPDAFGRLYVVMRLYSTAWGLLGVVVMFNLARRISKSLLIGSTAAMCYSLLPTVINAAHEAKPHLAGAVLGLIAVDMALKAIESRQWRWVITTAAACGAAASMVLSGWLLIAILPTMAICMSRHVLAQPGRAGSSPKIPQPIGPARNKNLLSITPISCITAAVVYSICNPYVIVHLLSNRTLLQSNLENSAAMYQTPASLHGILHGVHLLLDGGSTTIFCGMLAIALFVRRKDPTAWLLLMATAPGLYVFLLHATGKPGEYGRFALSFDLPLILAAALGMSVVKRKIERAAIGSVLILMLLPFGLSYVLNYGRETFAEPTRLLVAKRVADLSSGGTLAVDAEPAPYVLPPLDLFRWKILLEPRGMAGTADADVRIDPVDVAGLDGKNVDYLIRPLLLPTPISWAAKPFRIQTRPDAASAAQGRP